MKTLLAALLLFSACFAQTNDSSPRGLATVVFANLGTPSNGTIVYCSNCTTASPTASGGTGAVVQRVAGAWNGLTGTVANPISALTYNASGTTTFAAASASSAQTSMTTTHSTSTTLSFTGLVAGGSYTLWVNGDATGGAVTATLSGGTCAAGAWLVGNGLGHVLTFSAAANSRDELVVTYDGTSCWATLIQNFTN